MRRRSALLMLLAVVVATLSLSAPPAGAAQSFVLLTKWGTLGAGNGQFDNPLDATVDAAGNVFVSDLLNRRVEKFNPDGGFLTSFNRTNVGPFTPTFLGEVGVIVAGNNVVYVRDRTNHKLVKYTSGGFFLTKWDIPPNNQGGTTTPAYEDLALDSAGNVYLITNSNEVWKYSPTGTLLAQFQTGLAGPSGIVVDASNNIFVLGGLDARLVKLSPRGATVFNNPIPGLNQLDTMTNLTLDPSGRLWTSANFSNQLRAISQTGALITTVGSAGSGDLQFHSPIGIVANPSGALYVVDTGNDRIQKVTESATLTVVYNTDGSGAIDSSYLVTGPNVSQSFSLDDDTDPTLSDTKVMTGLVPGVYNIARTSGPYGVKSIFCSNGVQFSNYQADDVDIALLAGGSVTCQFYEEWIG